MPILALFKWIIFTFKYSGKGTSTKSIEFAVRRIRRSAAAWLGPLSYASFIANWEVSICYDSALPGSCLSPGRWVTTHLSRYEFDSGVVDCNAFSSAFLTWNLRSRYVWSGCGIAHGSGRSAPGSTRGLRVGVMAIHGRRGGEATHLI
jgi:hypothetical protein